MPLSRRQFLKSAAPVAVTGAAAGIALAQTSSYLKGIDVSRWQLNVNWTSVKAAGNTFAFCKANDGLTGQDPYFAQNWPAMKAAGLIRGAYHFARPNTSAIAQADAFFNIVKPTRGDLQLVVDLESAEGQNAATIWAWTQAFVQRIKERTGRPCIIYTGFYFWRDVMGNPSNNLNCPLWLPSYSVTNPANLLVPAAWSTWSFWQYSSTGSVPGISGNVDLNYFKSSLAQLQALCLPNHLRL